MNPSSQPENTKQQIEEMISDFCEDAIRYGEELHTGRVKSDEEIKADSVELLQKQTEILEDIDRLVTEAVEASKAELREKFGIDANKKYDVKIGNGVIVIQESQIINPQKEES